MKKTIVTLLVVALTSFGLVGTSHAGWIKVCWSNTSGTMRYVSPSTAACNKGETGGTLQTYVGSPLVYHGHMNANGFMPELQGWPALLQTLPHNTTGVYTMTIARSGATLPDCGVSATVPASCEVSGKTSGSVTVSCFEPTISGGQVVFVPADADFDIICAETD